MGYTPHLLLVEAVTAKHAQRVAQQHADASFENSEGWSKVCAVMSEDGTDDLDELDGNLSGSSTFETYPGTTAFERALGWIDAMVFNQRLFSELPEEIIGVMHRVQAAHMVGSTEIDWVSIHSASQHLRWFSEVLWALKHPGKTLEGHTYYRLNENNFNENGLTHLDNGGDDYLDEEVAHIPEDAEIEAKHYLVLLSTYS